MTGPARLADLPPLNVTHVYIRCSRCGHSASLPVDALVEQLGPDHPVPTVGRRCKCSRCGSKEITSRPDWGPGPGVISRHED